MKRIENVEKPLVELSASALFSAVKVKGHKSKKNAEVEQIFRDLHVHHNIENQKYNYYA